MSSNSSISNNAATKKELLEKRRAKILDGVGAWAAYYRANPHRFVKEYLHINLKLFQMILLCMMNMCATVVFIAARGLGKTYLSAIFCVVRAVLYPGTKICVASGTKGQSITVLEKIMNELLINSKELASEIDQKRTKMNASSGAIICFKNGSYIKVVTATDNARGNRANLLLLDEFRLIKKDTIDTILRKFLASPRHPGYLDLPQYKDRKDLLEPNMTMYLSSAYYKDHWSYTKSRDVCKLMISERADFVCGFPYQLSIQEGLLMESEVLEQISDSDFNEVKWKMEMEAEFFGDEEGSFFQLEPINKTRKLEWPMLPAKIQNRFPSISATRIPPKKPGEKRILSADIALMATTRYNNDATAIFINQAVPTKSGRFINNIVYSENIEGAHTGDTALFIRRLFDEFDCDYIVLDCRNMGLGVYDALVREISDTETGEIYPPLSCCNNPELAARCTSRDAKKVIWGIIANAKFNSDCALLLREGFRSGRLRLLINEIDAEEQFGEVKSYSSLSPEDKAQLILPYVNTSLLISEMISLNYEENGGLIRMVERGHNRKDRYSSLSYNYYVATELEKSIVRTNNREDELAESFVFRAPKIK